MIDINLTGVWHTCKAAIPHLIDQGTGGSIIITSSTAGLQGHAERRAVHRGQARVVGLMRTLALELAPHRIRVNTVHPTSVDTDMIQNEATYRLFLPDVGAPDADDGRADLPDRSTRSRSRGWSRSTSATPCCSSPRTSPGTSPASSCKVDAGYTIK